VRRKERPRDPHADPARPGETATVAEAPPLRAASPRDVLRMQQTAGNQAVHQLLRQPVVAPDKPKTDAEQWEADWNDPQYAGYQKHFEGPDRPVGDKKFRYDTLCPLYKAQGIARPLKYVRENIISSDFFGHGTPMHTALKTALKAAETTLKAAGVTSAPFTKCWAFNARTQTGGQWSNHADGKAIDIDEVTNPRLLDPGHRAVISALTNMDISAANPGAGEGLDSYDASAQASQRFQTRYSGQGMTERIAAISGEEADLEQERKEIADALDLVPTGKKGEAKPTADQKAEAKKLKAQLAAKQAEIAAQVAARKTLEKERKRFEALDKAVDDLQLAIDGLSGEIDVLGNELEALAAGQSLKEGEAAPTGKALDQQVKARKTAIAGKTAAIKAKQKQLEKAAKTRDDDTLRGYAGRGFLDLDKDMVEALKAAGLRWGGDYKGAKDFMHFEVV
jgi:hypothetical protein